MTREDLLILGETDYRNSRKRFGLKKADRRRHTYIIGKTGMGKSTLLLNMMVQDIRTGKGLALLDPHGDLAEKILGYIPKSRVKDTIYFDPSNEAYPIAFNPLHSPRNIPRHLIASGVVQAMKKIWPDFWGPRMEHILRNALLALLELKGATLLHLSRFLTDEAYRKRVVYHVRDPIIRDFWNREFNQFTPFQKNEFVSPILNKIGQFLSTPLLRNILGQPETKFDLRDVMDNKKILIMNLSQGRLGEDNSSLLGSLMVTGLYLTARSRVDTPEEGREDFYLYLDELQSFTTEDFPSILAEARKYRLVIAGMANQFIAQLPGNLKAAILGNVGTLISFAIGSDDAKIIADEFYPVFTREDLQNMSIHQIYLKLSIDRTTSTPFCAHTLPPEKPLERSLHRDIVGYTRRKYCLPKSVINARLIK